MLHLNRDIIAKIPFFEGQDPGFVSYAVSLMKPEVRVCIAPVVNVCTRAPPPAPHPPTHPRSM